MKNEIIKKIISWDNLFRVIGTVVAILVAYFVYKMIVRAIKRTPPTKLSAHKSVLIVRIVKYLFDFVLIMCVLNLFGVKLSAIWGAAGVAGIAIAFAAQTSFSNIISGIFILAEKTMKIGDLVTVEDKTGIVDVIGLLSVQIHTLDNQLIRIPNSSIINTSMINNSYFPIRRMCIEVSVSYDTDMQKALSALEKVPSLCKYVLKEPSAVAWFDKFDESRIKLTLAVWFASSDFLATKNEVFITIKKVFDQEKIKIPYNKLDVNFAGIDFGDKSSFEFSKTSGTSKVPQMSKTSKTSGTSKVPQMSKTSKTSKTSSHETKTKQEKKSVSKNRNKQ